jgi:RNA ligase
MHLSELMDLNKLEQHIQARLVSRQKHPTLPLWILNYTPEATFSNTWDEITTLTRGLIINDQQEVIARGFNKFFNVGDTSRPETALDKLLPGLPEVTEKLDGSLGIYWKYAGEYGIATRGSFTSDQAQWATQYFRQHHAYWVDHFPEWVTPVFEIIYPDNRIVVQYDWEGLILLSMIDNKTGYEPPYATLRAYCDSWPGFPLVKKFERSLGQCMADNDKNAEGYVLTWKHPHQAPFRVKVKFSEYVRLHKLITGVSPKAIWEILAQGQSLEPLIAGDLPVHFTAWVEEWETRLEVEYRAIERAAEKVYRTWQDTIQTNSVSDRKAAAAVFTRFPQLAAILFKMLDGQPYAPLIWKMVKPKVQESDVFKRDEER